MIWLFLSIASSVIIVLLFKSFERYDLKLFQIVVFNYLTCVLLGSLLSAGMEVPETQDKGWIGISMLLGMLFISLFYMIGITTQKIGITVASVSMKLSLVVPVALAFIIYKEPFNWQALLGILCALIAVAMVSFKKQATPSKESAANKWLYLLPFLLFAGSGTCDSLLQYAEKQYFEAGGFENFVLYLFMMAGISGFLFLLPGFISGKQKPHIRSIFAGVILGIPNYGSIYFFMKVLNEPGWESSIVFPMNNIGIVAFSALGALLLFKENLSKLNLSGLAMGILAIALIAAA